MTITLVDRYGKQIALDAATLPTDQREQIIAGVEVTYRRTPYIFSRWSCEGEPIYVEKCSWQDKHPLVQLDMKLRHKP